MADKKKAAPEQATLTIGDKNYQLDIIVGSEGEKALDIKSLRADTGGYIALDNGYMNVGACKSDITYLNGEEGILRYRGYPIEELAGKASFIEVAYLLIHDALPTHSELKKFSNYLAIHSLLHEDMRHFFYSLPADAHPMAVLSSSVVALSSFYPELKIDDANDVDLTVARLLSKIRTIAAWSFKKTTGDPFLYPLNKLKYVANFLNMMFATPVEPYEINEDVVKALDLCLVLHADHEQNCSTSTVRLVGSARVNLYAAISAGICALWGPLHGGANEDVINTLEQIQADGGNYKKYIDKAKDKNDSFRLPGFGHRVYKTLDPRARILKEACDKVLVSLGVSDPLLDIAKNLEEIALTDSYFIERNLYPNVDFYSGIIYKAIGIPNNMFTVLFALARLPGWIAQWKEARDDPNWRIGRPRQLYTGPTKRVFIPIEDRVEV